MPDFLFYALARNLVGSDGFKNPIRTSADRVEDLSLFTDVKIFPGDPPEHIKTVSLRHDN